LAAVNELLCPGADIVANNDSKDSSSTILSKRKSRGVNIEAKDNDGDTPLHLVGMFGHVAIVKALLSCWVVARTFSQQTIEENFLCT
jgi:ankyrin repeat protein